MNMSNLDIPVPTISNPAAEPPLLLDEPPARKLLSYRQLKSCLFAYVLFLRLPSQVKLRAASGLRAILFEHILQGIFLPGMLTTASLVCGGGGLSMRRRQG